MKSVHRTPEVTKWPSGFAGGYVTKDPAFRQRFLCFTSNPGYKTNEHSVLIAKFDVVLGKDKCLASYRKVQDGDEIQGTLWTVWREIAGNSPWYNNQSYVDTLNKAAIDKFIEITHERYKEAVGRYLEATYQAGWFRRCRYRRIGMDEACESRNGHAYLHRSGHS